MMKICRCCYVNWSHGWSLSHGSSRGDVVDGGQKGEILSETMETSLESID